MTELLSNFAQSRLLNNLNHFSELPLEAEPFTPYTEQILLLTGVKSLMTFCHWCPDLVCFSPWDPHSRVRPWDPHDCHRWHGSGQDTHPWPGGNERISRGIKQLISKLSSTHYGKLKWQWLGFILKTSSLARNVVDFVILLIIVSGPRMVRCGRLRSA